MYCTDCGVALDVETGVCPACVGTRPQFAPQRTTSGTLFGVTEAAATGPARGAPQVTAKVKEASKDATQSFRIFATNPVGGLPEAFENLGPSRAMGVGIVFAAFSILCVFIGRYVTLSTFEKPDFFTSLQILIFGAVPFVSLLAASAATRKVFRGEGSFGGDSLIAGASLLPFGFFVLVFSVLGIVNREILALLFIFALCYGILMLYTGVTRISSVAESRAAFAVPVMIIVSCWLTKILVGGIVPSLLPSFGG